MGNLINKEPIDYEVYEGKTFLNKGKIITINHINAKTLHIETADAGGIRFEELDDLNYFIQQLKPVNDNTAVLMVDTKGDNIMSKLFAGLVADFEKLESNPEYVNQAKQRSNQANTVINLTKLQLQMMGKQ
jgi:hypothetical protein